MFRLTLLSMLMFFTVFPLFSHENSSVTLVRHLTPSELAAHTLSSGRTDGRYHHGHSVIRVGGHPGEDLWFRKDSESTTTNRGGTPTPTTTTPTTTTPTTTAEDSGTPTDTSNAQSDQGSTTPSTTTEGSDGTPAAEDSGTPTDTSSAQQVGSSTPQATQGTQSTSTMQPLRVTEYMVRDWAGVGGLPQWIELYNPNTRSVNLKGYTFQYATRQLANDPYKIHTLKLADTEDGFSIAGGGVAILATQKPRDVVVSGIEISSQVYNLSIQNVLKRGWVLMDADGEEIQRLGRTAFSALSDPVAPSHQGKARVSYHVYPSESPPEPYYYGHSDDVGSPGFYEEPAPAAPSAVIRKTVGTWASLKRGQEKF